MRLRRKRVPQPYGDWPLIQDWQIDTQMTNGSVASLAGHVYGEQDAEAALEWVRYVRAIRDGLRAAGFDAEVTIKRTEETRLP